MNLLFSIFTGPDVSGLIFLVIANLVFGVSAAIIAKTFDWGKLPQFAQKDVLVLLIYVTIAAIVKFGGGDQLETFRGLQALILAAFIPYLIMSIRKSLAEILKRMK